MSPSGPCPPSCRGATVGHDRGKAGLRKASFAHVEVAADEVPNTILQTSRMAGVDWRHKGREGPVLVGW